MSASASSIRAGGIFVEIGANASKFQRALRRAQQRLRAFGAAVQQSGQKMLGVGLAAAMPFAMATRTFAGFEQQMSRVKALTGANEADFNRLSEAAQRLGRTTVFSASQAAEAMSSFALAGFDVDKILTAIGPTLDLAAAGQLEIGQAADIATKIMAGMGIEANELGGAIDVLAKAMTTANTDLGQLGDAMKFVGPIAKSAGLAFEEVIAAIQLLSNAGIQGEMAGTTLRGAILALTSPSSEAASVMSELGIRVNDAQGNVRPLVDILIDMSRAMEGLGSGERLDLLGRIFPARTAAGMAELLSQGSDRLKAFTDNLRNSGGTAKRIADTQLNTLQGAWMLIKSAVEGVAIAVGQTLVGPLRVAAHAITHIVGVAVEWINANQTLVVMVAGGVVAITAMGAALIATGIAIKMAALALGVLAVALKAVIVLVGTIFSPLGLIVGALAVAAAALVDWGGVVDNVLGWAAEKFRWLKGAVTMVLDGIRDAMASGDTALAAEIMWKAIKIAWLTGAGAIQKVWVQAKQAFLNVLYQVWSAAIIVVENACHAIEVAYIETTAFLTKHLTAFLGGFRKAWNAAINWTTKKLIGLMGFFDDEIDVTLAQKMADDELADLNATIDRETQAAIGAREARRQNERDTAERVHEGTIAEVGEAYAGVQDELERERNETIERTERELADAKKALKEAIAKAKADREAEKEDTGPKFTKPQMGGAKTFDDWSQGVQRTIKTTISSVGTFSAAALSGLGYNGAEDRIARATEETAKYTRWLANDAKTNRATFA